MSAASATFAAQDRRFARDLSTHMQQQIGEIIMRNAKAARVVLQPVDVYIMMLEAAASVTLSAAASMAANATDAAEQAALFDRAIASVQGFIAADRDNTLAAIATGGAVQL